MSCECNGEKCRMSKDDRRHGTNNGYQNLWCRCEQCRSAHAEYYYSGAGAGNVKRYRAKKIAEGFALSSNSKRVREYRPRENARGRRKDRTHKADSDA